MATLIKIIRNETQLTYGERHNSNIEFVYHFIILHNILQYSVEFSEERKIEIIDINKYEYEIIVNFDYKYVTVNNIKLNITIINHDFETVINMVSPLLRSVYKKFFNTIKIRELEAFLIDLDQGKICKDSDEFDHILKTYYKFNSQISTLKDEEIVQDILKLNNKNSNYVHVYLLYKKTKSFFGLVNNVVLLSIYEKENTAEKHLEVLKLNNLDNEYYIIENRLIKGTYLD